MGSKDNARKQRAKERLRLAFANQASYMLLPPSSDQLNESLVRNEMRDIDNIEENTNDWTIRDQISLNISIDDADNESDIVEHEVELGCDSEKPRTKRMEPSSILEPLILRHKRPKRSSKSFER